MTRSIVYSAALVAILAGKLLFFFLDLIFSVHLRARDLLLAPDPQRRHRFGLGSLPPPPMCSLCLGKFRRIQDDDACVAVA